MAPEGFCSQAHSRLWIRLVNLLDPRLQNNVEFTWLQFKNMEFTIPLWPRRDLNPRHPDYSLTVGSARYILRLRVWCSNQAELRSHYCSQNGLFVRTLTKLSYGAIPCSALLLRFLTKSKPELRSIFKLELTYF